MPRHRQVQYGYRIAAQLVLTYIAPRERMRPKYEVRVYKCPDCHGWHLTSKQG